MKHVSRTDLFESASIPRAIAGLTIPTILSSLVMVIYNLADTYFVGMLNDPVQNAGVTLAMPVMLAFYALNNLFGVGCSSMMSRAMGRGDHDTVSRSSAFGFWCSLAGGLLFSAGCTLFKSPLLMLLGADASTREATSAYMLWTVSFGAAPSILNVVMAYMVRSEGNTIHASVGTMSGCLLNMVLDPLFILPGGLNMGSAGAGLATLISNCAACGYFFVLLFVRRKKTYIRIHPRYFGFRREIVKGVFAVGLPAAIQNLLNVVGMTVLNNYTAAFGADAVAAMGIAQKINSVAFQIALGYSQGLMPLVGYNYASGNIRRMKSAVTFSLRLVILFMIGISVLYYAFSPQLMALFINDPTVIAYGGRFLRGFCLALPLISTDFLAVGVFQAVGMGGHALAFAVLRKIILEIPALWLLNLLFPLYGIPYAQSCAELVLAAVAIVILFRLFRRLERKQKENPAPEQEPNM